MPPNVQDSLTALMVHKLSIRNPRYDISRAYGPFLSGVPKRLGHNAALDAATDAFVRALPSSPHSRKQTSLDALHSYTIALEATRLALTDPVQSRSIDTLCAAYFLLVCQDRIGAPEDTGVHVAGINHMLNDPESAFDSCSAFDLSLVVVLCSIISGEMFLSTSLEAVPSSPCWKSFDAYTAEIFGPLQRHTEYLPLEMEIWRSFRDLSVSLHVFRPTSEALETHEIICSVIRDCRYRWHCTSNRHSTFGEASPEQHSIPLLLDAPVSERIEWKHVGAHLRDTHSYGIALSLGLIMSNILRMYVPDQDGRLAQTCWNMFAEVVWLAKQSAQLKPLGDTFMAPLLQTLYAIGELRSQYQMDALSSQGMALNVERAMMLSKKLDSMLEPLRSRIAARYSKLVSSSESLERDVRCEEAQAHMGQSQGDTNSFHQHVKTWKTFNASAWWD